jgi:hypothetical protein
MLVCPLCRKEVAALHVDVEELTLDLIARDRPEWVREDGSCPACLDYYEGLGQFGVVDAMSD